MPSTRGAEHPIIMIGATRKICVLITTATILATSPATFAQAQNLAPFIFPEQRQIMVRDPSQLPRARVPDLPPPPTISRPPSEDAPRQALSLDNAIQTALVNAEVIRVLTGITAVSSGQTIYDPAITNTGIDQENARFDPTVTANNNFNRLENPRIAPDPLNPARRIITGSRADTFNTDVGISKRNVLGGTTSFDVNATRTSTRFDPNPLLNPTTASSAQFQYNQPLLQGFGIAPNMAPIVIARIDTERSYFQFKDSVQDLVSSVIEGYWNLVAARVDVWAREQQVAQSQQAFDQAKAKFETGLGSRGDAALARSALAQFRANLVAARGNLLNAEAAMRNVLGIPPNSPEIIIPVSLPATERLPVDWQALLSLAEQRRPDIIELKLILEADQQFLIQAENNARPRLDAVGIYRWNGLEGEMSNGETIRNRPGQFTDWTMGINFSVPLGLRSERASLRQRELIIARDRANLDQQIHSAVHSLAARIRDLDQFYEQFLALQEAREAAQENLDQQRAIYRVGQTPFLNVLQAITAWGDTITAEAQTLALYNSALAGLERETGTILETHGVTFIEERYGSVGPLGRFHPRNYPAALNPTPSEDRYPRGQKPSEDFFDLRDQSRIRRAPVVPELVPLDSAPPPPSPNDQLPQP